MRFVRWLATDHAVRPKAPRPGVTTFREGIARFSHPLQPPPELAECDRSPELLAFVAGLARLTGYEWAGVLATDELLNSATRYPTHDAFEFLRDTKGPEWADQAAGFANQLSSAAIHVAVLSVSEGVIRQEHTDLPAAKDYLNVLDGLRRGGDRVVISAIYALTLKSILPAEIADALYAPFELTLPLQELTATMIEEGSSGLAASPTPQPRSGTSSAGLGLRFVWYVLFSAAIVATIAFLHLPQWLLFGYLLLAAVGLVMAIRDN